MLIVNNEENKNVVTDENDKPPIIYGYFGVKNNKYLSNYKDIDPCITILVIAYIKEASSQFFPTNDNDAYYVIPKEAYFIILSYFWAGYLHNLHSNMLAKFLRDLEPQEDVNNYCEWPLDVTKEDGVKTAIQIPCVMYWAAICESLEVKCIYILIHVVAIDASLKQLCSARLI